MGEKEGELMSVDPIFWLLLYNEGRHPQRREL